MSKDGPPSDVVQIRELLGYACIHAAAGDPEWVAWVRSSRLDDCAEALELDADAIRGTVLGRAVRSAADRVLRDRAALVRLYRHEGLTCEQIADGLGVGRSTVHRWIERHGIESRARGARRSVWKSSKGRRMAEIAKQAA